MTKRELKTKSKEKIKKKTSRKKSAEKPHYVGHRQRARERLRKVGFEGIWDYEVVEMILFNANPRSDMKPLAKKLLAWSGNFPALIAADRSRLKKIDGVGDRVVDELHLANTIALRVLKHKIVKKPLLASWQDLFHYCQQRIGYRRTECLLVICLDVKHRLIEDAIIHEGGAHYVESDIAKITRFATEADAKSVVLAHNHPSGDPQPSQNDIAFTKAMAKALQAVDIKLQDHIIVAQGREASFHQLNLMTESDL